MRVSSARGVAWSLEHLSELPAKTSSGRVLAQVARIWCEQKWADLVAGELSRKMASTAVEHGALVARLRHRYAGLVDRALRLHSDALWQLDAAAASVVARREALADEALKSAARLDARDAEIAALRAKVDELERRRDADAAEARAEAEEKLERTRVALDAMKDLFHDLSKDKSTTGAIDLRDAAARMESELALASDELKDLRCLRDEAATAKKEVASARVELRAKRRAMEMQNRDLQERADMVNELMMDKGELAAYVAGDRAKQEEEKTLKGGAKQEGDVKDVTPPDDVEDAAQAASKQIEDHKVICVRCGRSLDNLEDVTRQQAAERTKRVRCLGFRMLLPELIDAAEARSHAWGQICMRAILVAKARSDAVQREEALCSRFPEFVSPRGNEPPGRAGLSSSRSSRRPSIFRPPGRALGMTRKRPAAAPRSAPRKPWARTIQRALPLDRRRPSDLRPRSVVPSNYPRRAPATAPRSAPQKPWARTIRRALPLDRRGSSSARSRPRS